MEGVKEMTSLRFPEWRVLVVVVVTFAALAVSAIETHINGHVDVALAQFVAALIALSLATLGHYSVHQKVRRKV